MPSAPCHARMAALQNHRGQPLTDADGQVLKVGSTVVDSKFGEGIARGTVPLEKGDGVNVQIDRRRRQQCWKATEPWHQYLSVAESRRFMVRGCAGFPRYSF